MFVPSLRNPCKVLTVNRRQEEHSISFLFYFHSVKRTHLINKSVLCLGTLRFDVNELFLDFHGVFKSLEFVYQPQQRYSSGSDGCLSSNLHNTFVQVSELQSHEVVPSSPSPHT